MAKKPKRNDVVNIAIGADLAERATEILNERELSIEEYIEIHLRLLTKRRKSVLSLPDVMSFGKYQGEIVEDAARVDPTYFAWLLCQESKIRFTTDVHQLVAKLVE